MSAIRPCRKWRLLRYGLRLSLRSQKLDVRLAIVSPDNRRRLCQIMPPMVPQLGVKAKFPRIQTTENPNRAAVRRPPNLESLEMSGGVTKLCQNAKDAIARADVSGALPS